MIAVDYAPRHCAKCDMLIYRDVAEAAVANAWWLETYARRGTPPGYNNPEGAVYVPHINQDFDGRCVECAGCDRGTVEQLKLAEGFCPYAAKNNKKQEKKVSTLSEQIPGLHGRYMAGESLKKLADEVGISWQALQRQFLDAGLPKREPLSRPAKPLAVEPGPVVATVPNWEHAPQPYTPPAVVRDSNSWPMAAQIVHRVTGLRDDLQALGVDVEMNVSLHIRLDANMQL